MKRYEEIVLEAAEKGTTFKGSNGDSKNYMYPPIPNGYKYVSGEWNNGFVIERCSDGSQMVWVPVGGLNANGTLDGEHFSEKFGRRNYREDYYFKETFYNHSIVVDNDLKLQLESVNKYGGFYISRHNISKSVEGKPQSVKGVIPWVNIDFIDACSVAKTFEDNEEVKSHLTYGYEYDSILEWFIQSKARTFDEIASIDIKVNGYWGNNRLVYNSPQRLAKTGSREEWCTNNIYDFAGNVREWTQEIYRCKNGGKHVVRGYDYESERWCVAERSEVRNLYVCDSIGFRVALYIK